MLCDQISIYPMPISDRIVRTDTEAVMWIFAIGITTAVTFILAYFCLSAGIYNVFPHLFYITIVVASYIFPVYGIIYTILLSLGYIGFQFSLVPEVTTTTIGIDAIIRAIAFISVSVVVSLTSSLIRRREATYQAILSSTPSGIVQISEDGKILDCNQVFLDFFSLKSQKLIEKDIFSFCKEPDNLKDFISSIKKGKSVPTIIPFTSTHADPSWLYINGAFHTNGSYMLGFSDLSELKQIREEREKDRCVLASLIDNIPEPVWMRDVNGILLASNRRFKEITHTDTTCVGKEDCNYTVAPFFGFLKEDQDVIRTGHFFQSTETISFSDIGTCHFKIMKSPIIDLSGAVIGITGVAFNITQLVQMQDEIQQREEQLQTVVGANPIGILVIDKEKNVLLVNHALEILLGTEKTEIMQTENLWELFGYPSKRPLLLEVMLEGEVDLALEQHFKGVYHPSPTVPGAFEAIQFFPASGMKKAMWLRFTAARITNPKGEIFGAIETIENYTELHDMTETLGMSEERFRTAARMATDFIFELDHATHMVSWFSDKETIILNDTLTTSRSYHIDEIVANIIEEDQERISATFYSHMETMEPISLEFRVIEESNTSRVWMVQAEVMPVSQGMSKRTIGVVSDITTTRLHEQRERDAYAAIEENIAQFAILGDHIRNPLQAITGYNDIRDGNYKEQIQEQIVIVNKIVDQLDRGWIRSDSIRGFLRRNYGLMDEKRILYPELDE